MQVNIYYKKVSTEQGSSTAITAADRCPVILWTAIIVPALQMLSLEPGRCLAGTSIEEYLVLHLDQVRLEP